MKTNYFIFPVLLFAALTGRAQLTLTQAANQPIAGDMRLAASHDSTTAVPKNIGANQSWNFTSMTPNSFTEVTTYVTPASATGSSLYPTATLASMRGSSNFEYFKATGSNWEFIGEYDSGTNDHMVLSNPALFMSYPVSITTTFSDVASGIQTSGANTTAVSGTLTYVASGSGTVTLPNGAVHNNCLQIIGVLVVSMGTGSNTSVMTQKSYVYYSSTKKFPIAEIQYQSETDASGTTKEFSSYFEPSGGIVGLSEIQTELLNVFPNPSYNYLLLTLNQSAGDASIEIYDMGGRRVLVTGFTPSLDVSSLSPGMYSLLVKTDQAVLRKLISIQR